MPKEPMILWDKKPEVRARWGEIISNPNDPRFAMVAADFLAASQVGRWAIDRIGKENLVRNWEKIRRLMEARGAGVHRIVAWDGAVRKLARMAGVRRSQGPKAKRAKHASRDPALAGFGAEIRALRRTREMTLEDLARKVGTTPAIVSRLERGLYNPSLRLLFRLSAVLGPEAAPVIFPGKKLPVRVEALPQGSLILTDGKDAIQLSLVEEAFAEAKCGAEMFGPKFYMALSRVPKLRRIFDRFCEAVKGAGLTLTEAFRVWFYQYHALRIRPR